MALRPCPECAREVSSKAPSCPNCGAKIRGSEGCFLRTMNAGCITIVAIVVLIYVIVVIVGTAGRG